MNKLVLTEWVEKFDDDKFDSSDVETQINAGWFDWFCNDKSLRNKTYKLAPKVKQIAKSEKIDKDKSYVFFKNNCPMDGRLYDDFRICDIESRDVIYTITPNCGHKISLGESQVWGAENGFEKPLITGTWKDVRNFFGV